MGVSLIKADVLYVQSEQNTNASAAVVRLIDVFFGVLF